MAQLKSTEDFLTEVGVAPVKAEDLQKKFDAVTKAEYDKQRTELQNTENKFYNKLYDTQKTTMDTIRQNNASAVATGASRGIQAANELSALLGLQQESIEGATDVANQATTLAQDETQAMLENVLTAEQQAREANQNLANILMQRESVGVEQQNANTAAIQALGTLEAQARADGNTTLADAYKNALDTLEGGVASNPVQDTTTPSDTSSNTKEEEINTPADPAILAGQASLSFGGSKYTINNKYIVNNESETVNKELDAEVKKLGYTDRYDPKLKDGTTVTININDYTAAKAGLGQANFWDVLGGIYTFGISNTVPENYTLTYYKGKWYASNKV